MATHELLDGATVSLNNLSAEERAFIRALQRSAKKGVDYFELERQAIGPGSPALAGRNRVDDRIVTSDVYRIARDIADRGGIAQGLFLAQEYESFRREIPTDGTMISVTQAANLIGISRSAVHKAIKSGSLAAKQIGNLLIVDKADALRYKAESGRASGGRGGNATARRGRTVASSNGKGADHAPAEHALAAKSRER